MQRVISERYGLKPARDWAHSLSLAISNLARERQVTPEAIERELQASPNHLRTIAGTLTVDETFFFRFPAQIDCAVAHVAEQLTAAGGRAVTVWSAGCSSGEEPYSIAVGLHRRLGVVPQNVSIVGCDINAKAIERARTGEYGEWSFRGVPDDLRSLGFERVGRGLYRIRESLRRNVRFEHLAIEEMANRLEADSVNLILFRNVGVYLDQPGLGRCFHQFQRLLAPDGLLIVAATDPSPPKDSWARVRNQAIGTYQRASPVGTLTETVTSRANTRSRGARCTNAAPSISTLRPPPVVEALALGDRGKLLEAIEVVSHSVLRNSSDSGSFFIRGQLHLADGKLLAAVEDFRRALFLQPESKLCRYWYIVALHASQETCRLVPQIAELSRQLAIAADDHLLEDGQTHASELRRALQVFESFYR